MLRTPRTSQCSRCLGFGYRDIKCRLYAEEHSSKQHKCGAYRLTELYQHIKARCFNCSGKHTADSKDCETYLTIRNLTLLNIYNKRDVNNIWILDRTLYKLPIPKSTILLGDFNIHYPV
ncbi:hypothetical protein M433DRAFT_159884 [Acidomyces richmondensis BFW]|nr:hypothetical protein M433DRAFT_159884 [Acidomyces richmondensis BFW]